MTDNTHSTEVDLSSKQDSTPHVARYDERGKLLPGSVINPMGRGGFADHPENRSNGSWTKEKTPRAKLENMLSEMTVGEFMTQIHDENIVANLDAKIGDVVVSGRLANIFVDDTDGSGKLEVNSKEFDALMYFIYGSRSENDTTITTDGDPFVIKGFVIPIAPEDFIDDTGRQKPQNF